MSEPIWDRAFDATEVGETWVDDEQLATEEPVSNDVLSLLNLGALKARISVRDHDIVIRTLKVDEELEIGLLIHKFMGTIEEGRALATAVVAASIETVDGSPLVDAGLGPAENTLSRKFDYVRTKMYWPVIKIIYEEGYIPLVERQVQSVDEFRKK